MTEEKKERKLLTPGSHRSAVVDGGLIETKKGDPQYAVTFKLLEGPDVDKTLTWWGNFATPKQQEFSFKALETLGWDGVVDLGGWKPTVGKEVQIVHGHREREAYGDKPARTENNVQFINSLGGGYEIKQLPPEKAKQAGSTLAALYKARQGNGAVTGSAVAANAFSASPTPITPPALGADGKPKDDLPF